ncbi:MAG TPA: hypothetical protein VEY11_03400 [Pyrinomonadaceae bacterium]|nr:hypothetical protein [Pyrinomonadaceae bacterium]
MKVFKQFCVVTVLTLVLAHAAVAEEGVIHPGIIPPPPPPSTTGVIHPGSVGSGEEPVKDDGTIDLVTEITLNIVKNLLLLF